MSKVKAAVCGKAGTNLSDLKHLDQFVHTHKWVNYLYTKQYD